MAEESDVESEKDYIDDLTGLAEPKGDMTFSSSETILHVRDPNLHPMGKAIAIFVLFTCTFGFLNGLDYATPEQGLIRPDEFIYRLSQSAPDETATFRGFVFDESGNGIEGATVYVSWNDDHGWNYSEVNTTKDGSFELEKLDPGLIRVDVIVQRDGHRDVLSNRALLSPPAMIEPIGFTHLDFIFPSEDKFAAQQCSNGAEECEIRSIDNTPNQMDHPLLDPSAGATYIMIGFGFMGLALIAAGFAVWALKSGSVGVLRTAATMSMFTMGHYYTACIFGLMAILLTFAIPKKEIPLMQQ